MKKKIVSKSAPAATGPFSHAVETEQFVFTSGQIYLTSDGKLLEGSFEDQVHQTMKNLAGILKEAQLDFSRVVKTTIFVTDMASYGTVNKIYGSYMSDPFPAREVICVKELPLGAKLEISMIAAKQ
jgi:2-iminobutanoate/2-iminopropanoate deaminase